MSYLLHFGTPTFMVFKKIMLVSHALFLLFMASSQGTIWEEALGIRKWEDSHGNTIKAYWESYSIINGEYILELYDTEGIDRKIRLNTLSQSNRIAVLKKIQQLEKYIHYSNPLKNLEENPLYREIYQSYENDGYKMVPHKITPSMVSHGGNKALDQLASQLDQSIIKDTQRAREWRMMTPQHKREFIARWHYDQKTKRIRRALDILTWHDLDHIDELIDNENNKRSRAHVISAEEMTDQSRRMTEADIMMRREAQRRTEQEQARISRQKQIRAEESRDRARFENNAAHMDGSDYRQETLDRRRQTKENLEKAQWNLDHPNYPR